MAATLPNYTTLVPNTLIAIKGIQMPSPSEMSYILQDFDSDLTTRSTDGTMIRDRITVKRKVECTWRVLSPSEVSLLLRTIYTADNEYNAVSEDTVTLPADFNDYYNMSATEQQELLDRIRNYTGITVDPSAYYSDETYRSNTQTRVADQLADYNAERNDRIFFPLTFYDPMLAQYTTMTVYVGDRTVPWLWAQRRDDTQGMSVGNHYTMFNNITANFIEK